MFKEYFGIRFEFDHDEVDRIIEERIEKGIPGYVVSLDMNNFALARTDENHMKIVNSSIVNNCDSSWIPFFVNRLYHTNYTFYRGDDVFLSYIKKCKYRQFFLGSNQKVLNGLKKEMTKLDPQIANMRFEDLPFRKVDEFDYDGIAKMINEDAPDIIWVSLGCPKQEQFMTKLLPYLKKGVMFGYGAIFNFYSGLDDVEKGAPKWVVNMKLQFIYRLFQSPKKQWPRIKRALNCMISSIKEEKAKIRASRTTNKRPI